jgi:SPP1 family predicted phage head-tail adaptor
MRCKDCERDNLTRRLKHRVEIYAPPAENMVDHAGQPLDEPTLIAKIQVGIEPLRGRELYAAQKEHGEINTRIVMRYRDDVFERATTVKYKLQTFDVLYPIHVDYARKELHLMCKLVMS